MNKQMDGAWDILGIDSLNGTFIALQMKSFGPQKIENTCMGLRSAILAIFQQAFCSHQAPLTEFQKLFLLWVPMTS